MSGRTDVLIAGGGTAGHVLPGLAVAAELVERGIPAERIHFVGAQGRIEERIVPEAGFEVTLLPGRGIQRRLTLANLGAALGILRALGRSVRLVRRRRPGVVLALGGFASVTCALAAILWRVPLIVADQNARAGASNRLVGRFARACAVPFADTDLPKAVVTGNPVRAEILESAAAPDREAAREALGLDPDRLVVVAFAGSLGSRRINEAIDGVVEALSDRSDLAVLHVVGTRDWDGRPEIETRGLQYLPIAYSDRMELVLGAADVAVCRSGGTTVAELAVVGVPAVLVPLPIATRDHQRANAEPLVRAGAAVLVPDDELDARRLLRELEPLLDPAVLAPMAAAARSLGRPDAAGAVADLLQAQLRTRDHR